MFTSNEFNYYHIIIALPTISVLNTSPETSVSQKCFSGYTTRNRSDISHVTYVTESCQRHSCRYILERIKTKDKNIETFTNHQNIICIFIEIVLTRNEY